jgi:hypothetical protein
MWMRRRPLPWKPASAAALLPFLCIHLHHRVDPSILHRARRRRRPYMPASPPPAESSKLRRRPVGDPVPTAIPRAPALGSPRPATRKSAVEGYQSFAPALSLANPDPHRSLVPTRVCHHRPAPVPAMSQPAAAYPPHPSPLLAKTADVRAPSSADLPDASQV